jgi:hypothetical protein
VSGLHLPAAGEPEPNLAAALDALTEARTEVREAARLVALLQLPAGMSARRREIELVVAEKRLQLWIDAVRRAERDVVLRGGHP